MLVADQSMSSQLQSKKLARMMAIVDADKDLASVVGYTGTGGGGVSAQTNTAAMFLQLKPLSQRDGVEAVIARLRRNLAQVPGARLYLTPVQDIQVGGRQSNSLFTNIRFSATPTAEVSEWTPKLLAALELDPTFSDISSDQQQNGLGVDVTVDRDTASRLGLTMYQIDNTLYDAFGQRSVSVIYNPLNQYRVVMRPPTLLAASRHSRPDVGQQVGGAAEWLADHSAQRRLGDRRTRSGPRPADRDGHAAAEPDAFLHRRFGGQYRRADRQCRGRPEQLRGIARPDDDQRRQRDKHNQHSVE